MDRQYQILRSEILDVIDRTLSSGQVLDGHQTELFEQNLALLCNRKYAVTVNSGTQALIMSILSFNEYNQVHVPNFSFIATKNSVFLANRVPVYHDTDQFGCIDVENKHKTSGVLVAVNLYGNLCDFDKLSKNHQGPIIEDAAQSLGSSSLYQPSGNFGTCSILSFDPMKNLPNFGSGGAILTDDEKLYTKLINLKNNGKQSNFTKFGTNSKMSEIDCAMMNVKLGHLSAWQSRRQDIALYYTEILKNKYLFAHKLHQFKHSWHKFVILCPHGSREKIQSFCLENDVETRVNYPYVLDISSSTPIAKGLMSNSLSLPIYPEMTDSEVEHVAQTVLAAC